MSPQSIEGHSPQHLQSPMINCSQLPINILTLLIMQPQPQASSTPLRHQTPPFKMRLPNTSLTINTTTTATTRTQTTLIILDKNNTSSITLITPIHQDSMHFPLSRTPPRQAHAYSTTHQMPCTAACTLYRAMSTCQSTKPHHQ